MAIVALRNIDIVNSTLNIVQISTSGFLCVLCASAVKRY
jgi:hypothetical protein